MGNCFYHGVSLQPGSLHHVSLHRPDQVLVELVPITCQTLTHLPILPAQPSSVSLLAICLCTSLFNSITYSCLQVKWSVSTTSLPSVEQSPSPFFIPTFSFPFSTLRFLTQFSPYLPIHIHKSRQSCLNTSQM